MNELGKENVGKSLDSCSDLLLALMTMFLSPGFSAERALICSSLVNSIYPTIGAVRKCHEHKDLTLDIFSIGLNHLSLDWAANGYMA